MRRILLLFTSILFILIGATISFGYNIYYGNLHSHTVTGGDDGSGTYAQAFNYARYTAGLHFFAITPHNHMISDATYTSLLSAASSYNADGIFVAIAGQECFTYDTGHVNVYEANSRVNIPNGKWNSFYQTWLPAHPEVAFVQFNHPDAANMFNSFAYNTVAANYIKSVEIQNGPAFSTSTTESDRGSNYESEFQTFLNKGWKLAPTANQDNHNPNWGKSTPNRTGVLATALTKTEILNAFRKRRIFATQDKTLAVIFVADSTHFQGSEYARTTGTVTFTITAWDTNINDRITTVRLYGDLNGIGGAVASILTTINVSTSSTQLIITRPTVPGETYYYVKVTQTDGDSAWTAPIWIRQLTTADITAPAFSGITAVVDIGTGGKLNLFWAPASDVTPPITYNIYRSTTSGIFDFTTPIYTGISGTSFTDQAVSNGTTYYYIIRAVDYAFNEDTNTIELSGIPTGTEASLPRVVINEFKAKFSEYIELYNAENTTVNISGWQLVSSSAGVITTYTAMNILGNGYSVISTSSKLAQDGDIIVLRTSASVTIDRVAYGNQGKAPIDPTAGISISRLPNGTDTDDDGADFNMTGIRTSGSANQGNPSNLGDSPIKLNEIALSPLNQIELYNSSQNGVDLNGWLLSDGDDLLTISGYISSTSYLTFSYPTSAGNPAGLSLSDNFYLFNQNTVRFDQVGFDGGPLASGNTTYTYQRYPDGYGINDAYNWTGAQQPNGWEVPIEGKTLSKPNVPVELSYFGTELDTPAAIIPKR
ncbi:MAG: CehA/McbA family metallohydrolase [bacterium]|nr:CehA/McbA family metallohydrolase [bacterium]